MQHKVPKKNKIFKKIFSSYLIRKKGTMIIKKTLKKTGCFSE